MDVNFFSWSGTGVLSLETFVCFVFTFFGWIAYHFRSRLCIII